MLGKTKYLWKILLDSNRSTTDNTVLSINYSVCIYAPGNFILISIKPLIIKTVIDNCQRLIMRFWVLNWGKEKRSKGAGKRRHCKL